MATMIGESASQLVPGTVAVDTVANRPGNQIPVAIVPQSHESALIVLRSSQGRAKILIKQVSVTGSSASTWPNSGVEIADDAGTYPGGLAPVGACTDDSAGCFVLAMGTIPIDQLHFKATLLMFRLLPDGSRDPRWPAQGRALTEDGNEFNLRNVLVPDGAGGTYAAWTATIHNPDDSVRVMLQRVDADGAVHQGWSAGGVIAIPSASLSQWYPSIVNVGGSEIAVLLETDDGAMRLKGLSGDGTSAPGWPIDGIAVGVRTDAPNSGSSRLLASGEKLAVSWTCLGPSTQSPDAACAVVLDQMGSPLPNWPTDGTAACPSGRAQRLEALGADTPSTFSLAWIEGGTELYFGNFRLEDGAPSLGVRASYGQHAVKQGDVVIQWSSNAPDDFCLYGLRSVDGGAWSVRDSARHAGAGQLLLTDDWPAGMTTVDYALGVPVEGEYQTVSDTLRITAAPVAGGLHLEMEGVQSGRSLWMYLSVAAPGQEAEVRAYDVSGRCLATQKLGVLPGGTHLVELKLPNPRQGIVFVRATSRSGSSSARTALLN